MTDEEKKKLIISYQEDYHHKTGSYIKMAECSKWEAVVDLHYEIEFWKLVKVIMDFTSWPYKKIFNLSRHQEVILKRGLIDFIAVKNGLPLNTCAKLTDREHGTVINSISKFENRLETEEHLKRFFYEVVKYVRDNYYLYKDQNITKESLRGGR